jgi:amino acid permease
MDEALIRYALISGSVAIMVYFFKRGANKEISSNEDGSYTLRMHKLFAYFGFFCIVLGLLVPSFIMFNPTDEEGLVFIAIGMFVFFFGAGLWIYFYYRNLRVHFDDETIVVTNLYGKTKEIQWKDIKDMKFSAMAGSLTISTDHDKVKVHQQMVGLAVFMKMVEQKTRFTAKGLKMPL